MGGLSHARVAVVASLATLVAPSSTVVKARVTNTGTTAVDIGDATVTAGTGYSLAANASLDVIVPAGAGLYAFGTVTSASIHVLRT